MALNATQFKVIEGGDGQAAVKSDDGLDGLYRQHHDRVFRAAYRVTGSVVDAEDVLQTVFLRLSRRGATTNLEPNPGSYLHRAAINAALDLMRQRGRQRQVSIEEVAPVLAGGEQQSPEARRRNNELRGAIRAAMGKLGERSAEMFALKYLEGYDNTEIARMMGTSAMVVGVLLHRARTRVKQEIGAFLEGSR